MELACVVSPVESYEDITNLPEEDHHQDLDVSIASTGLHDEGDVGLFEINNLTEKEADSEEGLEIDSNGSATQTDLNLHLDYDNVKNYRLFHFVISKSEIRPLLMNIHQSVNEVILKVCATFGIDRAEEYSLWLPKGMTLPQQNNLQPKLNFGSLTNIFKALKTTETEEAVCQVLDGNKLLAEQFSFNMKPYLLHLLKHSPLEDVDAGNDYTDYGEEWPAFEGEEVARQREFNQCWCGVVQGDYPIEMEVATKLAALLLKVYFSDKHPPESYSLSMMEQFLPEMYANSSEASRQVKQFYEALSGTSPTEAIDLVIQTCRQTVTYGGLFFSVQEIEVPGKFLSLKKSSKRFTVGINHHGVIKIDNYSGKVLSVKRFSDIHSGRCRENILHLSFRHWDTDFYAKTDQATKMLEVLRIYIDMTKRNLE